MPASAPDEGGMARSDGVIVMNRWVARFIPILLLGAIIYASVVVIKDICGEQQDGLPSPLPPRMTDL